MSKQNDFVRLGDTALLYCPSTTGIRIAVIDSTDLDRVLAAGFWRAANGFPAPLPPRFYACFRKDKRTVLMHRFLTDCPAGMVVDHINHDGLDNRRSANLRVVTHAENMCNRKVRRPSIMRTINGRYRSLVNWRGKQHYIGIFNTPELATAAGQQFLSQISGGAQ